MDRDNSPVRKAPFSLPSFVLSEKEKKEKSKYHKIITQHVQQKSDFHKLFSAIARQKPKITSDFYHQDHIKVTKPVYEHCIKTAQNMRLFAFPSIRNAKGSNDICRRCGQWCTSPHTNNKYGEYYCIIGQYRVDLVERERNNEEDPMVAGTASYPYPFFCKSCFEGIYIPQVQNYCTWVLGKLFDVDKILVVNREWTPLFVKGLTPRRLELAKKPIKNPADPKHSHHRFFYAAGKISGTEWRDTRYMHVDAENIRTYQHHGYKETDLVYVGPYPIGCDHKCWHSVPHAAANKCTIGGDCAENNNIQLSLGDVVENSQSQIRICEIFYARIEETDCFGTFSEIGYASAFGKAIYIDMAPNLKAAPDMWFLAKQSLRSPICDNDIKRIPVWKHFTPNLSSETSLVEQYKVYLMSLARPPHFPPNYPFQSSEEDVDILVDRLEEISKEQPQ